MTSYSVVPIKALLFVWVHTIVPVICAGVTADAYAITARYFVPRGMRDRSENTVIAGIPGNYRELPGNMKPSTSTYIFEFCSSAPKYFLILIPSLD